MLVLQLTIKHIHMDPIGSPSLQPGQLCSYVGKVRRQNRGGNYRPQMAAAAAGWLLLLLLLLAAAAGLSFYSIPDSLERRVLQAASKRISVVDTLSAYNSQVCT
jgi:hypothetical protein